MPPRWAATLTALSVLMVAYFTSRHLGPFSIDPNSFARVGAVALYMAALIVIDSMLVTALVQIRTTVGQLRQSEERYRYFVEKSFEAVWQVELAVPMALALEPAARLDWFRRHAGVAECNSAYLQLNRLHGLSDADARRWSGGYAVVQDLFRQHGKRGFQRLSPSMACNSPSARATAARLI